MIEPRVEGSEEDIIDAEDETGENEDTCRHYTLCQLIVSIMPHRLDKWSGERTHDSDEEM